MFYISTILFFSCDMLQNNSAETMEPAGPLNQSAGSARPEPDVALEMLIMFVLFTNAAQNRFLIFWLFLPLLSLGSIYTGSHSDINCTQRAFWFCHVKGSVCWRTLLGAKVYGTSDACVSVLISLVCLGEKVYQKSVSDS